MLGDVIGTDKMETLFAIANLEAPVDAARGDLNALLASKKNLEDTRAELDSLGLTTETIDAALETLLPEIAIAGNAYGESRVAAEKHLKALHVRMGQTHRSFESPVDLAKSQAKIMPLASDSLSLDVEYIAFDSNKQTGSSYASSLSSLVSNSTSWLGAKVSGPIAKATRRQVMQQVERHNISGTLVVCASCTHKLTCFLAPVVLDVDRSIKLWNTLFPSDRLNSADEEAMESSASPREDGVLGEENRFSVVVGMSFGSVFVGMAHILNKDDSGALGEDVASLRARMQSPSSPEAKDNITMMDDIKRLFSVQQVSSNISVISMGTIPSMVPNGIPEPAKTSAKQSEISEMSFAIDALMGRGDERNKRPGMGSLMTALDDYLDKAANGNSGIPINYYLKDITKSYLAELWVDKRKKSFDPNIY